MELRHSYQIQSLNSKTAFQMCPNSPTQLSFFDPSLNLPYSKRDKQLTEAHIRKWLGLKGVLRQIQFSSVSSVPLLICASLSNQSQTRAWSVGSYS